MPYADLHVHTTRSDGSLPLEAVPEVARRDGVDVVAVTDHDRSSRSMARSSNATA